MRKSKEEIIAMTPWCFYKDMDLVGVYYGDIPLRTYTAKDHERHERDGEVDEELAIIGADEAITWSVYGDFATYETGIGRILVATKDNEIIRGDIRLRYFVDWDIHYETMGCRQPSLSIMHFSSTGVQGWCNRYAVGSPSGALFTKEMSTSDVWYLLDSQGRDKDYGDIVRHFLNVIREAYEHDGKNYIKENAVIHFNK